MQNKESLSDCTFQPENMAELCRVDEIKPHIQNAEKRLKDEIVLNDIYTADEIFRIINKVFAEEFGKKFCTVSGESA